MINEYRIRRVDNRNIAIQRKKGKEWVSISYHGNSLNSLISGLFDLIMAQHIPDADNIASGLICLEMELIKGVKEVKEMMERDL